MFSLPTDEHNSEHRLGTVVALTRDVTLIAILLLQSLTLGPLSLSDFTTVPELHEVPSQFVMHHLPTEGTITSLFGGRSHPILGVVRHHDGIDIANPTATIIYATSSGRVSRLTRDPGYGLMVEIDHGGGWHTRYAHLASSNVRRGDYVFSGAMIARMGESGLATGRHLHYEVRYYGQALDPLPYIGALGRCCRPPAPGPLVAEASPQWASQDP